MTKRHGLALVGSFAIYLLPLIGPHASWLLGEHLFRGLTRLESQHQLAWVAMSFVVAFGAQAALGLLLAWVFARRSVLSFIALVGAIPVFFVVLEWTYLIVLPSYFLIERDTASEVSRWPAECFVPDVTLAPVRTPPGLPLERAGRAWISSPDAKSFAILDSCERSMPIDVSTLPPYSTPQFAIADGSALFAAWDREKGETRWWHLAAGGGAPAALARPPADPNRSAPLLTADGGWTAWKEYVPDEKVPPLPEQVVLRSLGDARERIVRLPPPGNASVDLVGVDMGAETLMLFEHDYATRENRLTTRGFDGVARKPPIVLAGAEPQSTTFLEVGDGWVAWDAYREDGRFRLSWSLAGGKGSSEVPLGSGITAVAVDPSGSYVAVSTTTTLNIGSVRDSVYVLGAEDGAEVFRRYLPKYTRSRVTFLCPDRFAHDDRDGERFGVRILRITPSESAP